MTARLRLIARHVHMATTSSTAAPWRSTFLTHIDAMDPPIFSLATLHPSEGTVLPRVRTVVYRGMWADMPVNPKNNAELNPAGFSSDVLTLTSDVRMEKIPEMQASAKAEDAAPQSYPGGPVEGMFWMAGDIQTQWRFRGRSFIIGPDIDSDAAAPVRAALGRHMRGKGEGWSWARELTAHFGNLSPGMRGSFRNPPPGRPLSEKPKDGLGLGQKVTSLDDDLARENFRVVAIVPEEVDRVDLNDMGRRWNYKFVGEPSVGAWQVTELWP